MIITSATFARSSGETSGPVGAAARTSMLRDGALLTLRDDRGNTGYGEASPLPGISPDELDAVCASLDGTLPRLVGRELPEALDEIELGDRSPSERFALETALVDLIARRRGVPARGLLGGERVVSVNGFAGSAGAPTLNASVASLLAEGYGTIKVKVGGGSFESERSAIARLRGELGDTWTLRLDVNGAWDLDEARANLESLAHFDVSLVEQPVAGAALLELGEAAIPWAADECLVDPLVRARFFDPSDDSVRRGCVAVVLKPALLGGILATRRAAAQATSLRLGVIVTHLFDGPVALAACRAVARSLPATPLACGLAPHPGLAAWPEVRFTRGPWVVDDDGPGLGIDGLA